MNSVALALVNGVVLSSVLSAALSLVLALLPRRLLNAATRYVIWCFAFAAVLLLPAFFRNIPRAAPTHSADSTGLQISVVEIAPAPTAAAAPRSLPLPLTLTAPPWFRWIIPAWILASSILLLRLFLSHRAVRRARAAAIRPPLEFLSQSEYWRQFAGSRASVVRVAASTTVAVPCACGPIRPAILIPQHLFSDLSAAELRHVGLHEAAHLARRDDIAILVERLLLALFPWHLAAWWVARQIDLEREIACDDRVVEAVGSAQCYAACLARVVELCGGIRESSTAAAMAGYRTSLSRRVVLLLAPSRGANSRVIPIRLMPFVAAILALTMFFARAPRLVAFQQQDSIPAELKERIPMPSNTRQLARKLAIAAAATAALAVPASASPAPPLTPQTQASAPATNRHLVLFLDVAAFSAQDLDRAVSASRKLIQTQMYPGVLMAIMVSNQGALSVKQDFTSDADLLLDTIQQLADQTPVPADASNQPDQALLSLDRAIHLLQPLGVKTWLIYLNVPETRTNNPLMQTVIQDAIKANVAFYPIDARGLIAR